MQENDYLTENLVKFTNQIQEILTNLKILLMPQLALC